MGTHTFDESVPSFKLFLLLDFNRLDMPFQVRIGLVVQEMLGNVTDLLVLKLMTVAVALVVFRSVCHRGDNFLFLLAGELSFKLHKLIKQFLILCKDADSLILSVSSPYELLISICQVVVLPKEP